LPTLALTYFFYFEVNKCFTDPFTVTLFYYSNEPIPMGRVVFWLLCQKSDITKYHNKFM